MSAIPQPNSPRMVSERILDPLRQVARRQWSVLAAKGVIQTLLVSLTLILLVALAIALLARAELLDYAAVPVWVRVAVSLVVWGAVVAAGVYFLRPALRKRSLVQTAMDVESRLGNTEERITSSVELGAETDARFAGSPVLVDHLVRQAER